MISQQPESRAARIAKAAISPLAGLAEVFTLAPTVQRASGMSPGQLWIRGLTSQDGEDYGSSYSEAVRAYNEVPTFRACLDLIAETVAEVPIALFEYEKDRAGNPSIPVRVPNHDVLTLLQDVNPLTSEYTKLMMLTVMDIYMEGRCYWQLMRDDRFGTPVEIFRRRPDLVTPIPDANQFVVGYDLVIGSEEDAADNVVQLPPEDIIYFEFPNPWSDYSGSPKYETARRSTTVDFRSVKYNQDFFENNARPDGLLTTEQDVSTGESNRIRAMWNSAFRGKSHRTAVLPFGLTYQQIATNPKDADFANLRRMAREDICAMFRVSPPLLGYELQSTNADMMAQMRQLFYELTVKPLLSRIAETLNWALLPKMADVPEGARLGFDYSSVPGMQENEDIKWRRWIDATFQGIATPNESRQALGIRGEVPWGDTWMMPRRYAPVEMSLLELEKAQEQGDEEATLPSPTEPPTPPAPSQPNEAPEAEEAEEDPSGTQDAS